MGNEDLHDTGPASQSKSVPLGCLGHVNCVKDFCYAALVSVVVWGDVLFSK